MNTEIKIIKGDSAKELGKIKPESVHLVVTSCPYDKLREYNGHNEWDFELTALRLFKVLVPGGILCWNVNDSVINGAETLTSSKQKIFFVESAGFRLHDTMIWSKSAISTPDPTRYHQCFEYVFILSKGPLRCFNPIRDKRNTYAGKTAFGMNTKRERNGELKPIRNRTTYSEFGVRTNVWHGLTRSQEEPCKRLDHHAMMPRWLARDLIRSFSNEGDVVLDPFAGSGTSGWEAYEMCRHAILIDKDLASFKMMTNRKSKLQPRLI